MPAKVQMCSTLITRDGACVHPSKEATSCLHPFAITNEEMLYSIHETEGAPVHMYELILLLNRDGKRVYN